MSWYAFFLKINDANAVHMKGLLLALLGSNRPVDELLYPHLLDQRAVLSNQFTGMTNEPFDYSDFEEIRNNLLAMIHQNFTSREKKFLLSFQSLEPDWSIFDFEKFPSVQWKSQNLQRLKENNPNKYHQQLNDLSDKFNK